MFTVVLDSCVLIPGTLADTFLRISQAGGFGIRWSSEILNEVQRNITRLTGNPAAALRRVDAMRAAFPHASVSGYERLTSVMTNDPKDRHVLAAAVGSQCDTIVTFNLKDFPPEAVSAWEVEAVHPDTFLLGQLDLAPGAVLRALKTQSDAYRSPRRSIDEILGTLARSGLPEFADEARRFLG